MGAAPDGMTANGVECGGTVAEADCPPGLADGTGPNLTINANLIMGNAADSGSGGGLRLQGVNGTEVSLLPTKPNLWNSVSVTNNIISNNVAGWDGGGVSLQDALKVNFINNTVMSNDTTASSGVLFNTLGAPDASAPGVPLGPGQTTSATTSAPQPAGLVVMQNSPNLTASIQTIKNVTCPPNNYAGTTAVQGSCVNVSYPYLANNVLWQNRAFYIGVGGAVNSAYQQNVVMLYNAFATTAAVTQPTTAGTMSNGSGKEITGGTGACVGSVAYWDLGVRGDTGPANHVNGIKLAPTYSVISSGDYAQTTAAPTPAANNSSANPDVLSQYCNGSRIPPEYVGVATSPLVGAGYQVPPGISDATVPNPIFNLSPSATVDEGNNWINMTWGPLSTVNPVTFATLGNYGPAAGSPVIGYIKSTAGANYANAPSLDFYGTPRKTDNQVDAGAVEYVAVAAPMASVTGGPLAFGNTAVTMTSAAQTLTLHNTGTGTLAGIAIVVSPQFVNTGSGTCGATLAQGATCTITIAFQPTAVGPATGTVTITGSNVASVTGSPVQLSGTGIAARTGATLTPATWKPVQTRNCPGTGLFGPVLCALDPTQTFTLTNTGNVTLTGITQGSLSGTNTADYAIVHGTSTCGPTGGGQVAANTTLAPNASCTVVVQFKPVTSESKGTKAATISVTDVVGTQSSTITGTAN
ncbi:MAG TPA: choice-of-anchor D domain-containing protein, partial [Acidobacteriaceae bacterium]